MEVRAGCVRRDTEVECCLDGLLKKRRGDVKNEWVLNESRLKAKIKDQHEKIWLRCLDCIERNWNYLRKHIYEEIVNRLRGKEKIG